MNRHENVLLVVAVSAVLPLLSLACTGMGECPEQEPSRAELEDGDYSLVGAYGTVSEDTRPHPSENVYVRVLSEDTVEVLYKRDDELVVETYQVTERDIETNHY